MREKQSYLFKNWAGNQQSLSARYLQPETEAELSAAIAAAKKVRLVGTGHSWSAACITTDTLINLDLYNRVLSLNKEEGTIRVQAGIKLWQLNNYLDENGMALANLGSIAEQSIAGAISTGTHGTGIQNCILASQVVSVRLILANGDIRELHAARDRGTFDTAIVSLGALGVLSELTLKVVPAFNLHDITSVEDYDAVVDKLDELISENDHFKLWWFPHTNQVVVHRFNRTQKPVNDSRLRQWLFDEVISVYMYRFLVKVGNINRNWRIHINRLLVKRFIQPLNRIEKSYKVLNVPKPPIHRETEWAFDIKNAKQILREYKQWLNNSPHRINFLQEIRFTKGDSYALSPCYGRDTMWLGTYNIDNYGWDELVQEFEALAQRYNGRPHWGKEFTVGADYLQKKYPQLEAFKRLRQLWDTDNKFVNGYIQAIIE